MVTPTLASRKGSRTGGQRDNAGLAVDQGRISHLSEWGAHEHRAIAMAARELSTWGWLFREQPVHDVGIDATAEDCAGGLLTGRLIALVLKAGRAFFSNPDGDGWLYHGQNEELS